jgi:predicted metalloendopeptidase
MDTSVSACDNFYQYVNGNWLKKTEIPAAFPSWGTWDILITRNRELSRDILQNAAKDTKAAKGSSAQLIGDFYTACMDEPAIESAGARPLEVYFKDIDGIKDVSAVQKEIAKLHRLGIPAVFAFAAYPDQKNSSVNIANAFQAGLSLPNSEYYTKTDDKSVEIRNKFVAHVQRMFGLLGNDTATSKKNADTVMAIEMRLAKASKGPVELRDPVQLLHDDVGGGCRKADTLLQLGQILEYYRSAEVRQIERWPARLFPRSGQDVNRCFNCGLEGLFEMECRQRLRVSIIEAF